MIPALKNAQFLRYGVMHRNTYLDSPRLLDRYYRLQGQDARTGIPTRQRMEQLGLVTEARRLHEEGPYPEWTGPALRPLDEYPCGGRRA